MTEQPADLKEQLEALNRKKEAAFEKKQQVSGQIADKIRQIGDFRKQRNDLTRQVRDIKKERDTLNAQITAKIAEIKQARPKKQVVKTPAPLDARGRPIRPGMLAHQIEALETKLETVPMSFDAEQKLMKTLKQLKKQHAEMEAAHGLSGELAAKSREIDELKTAANELHAKVTLSAKQSQEYHEKMLTLSSEIEELKKKEEEFYQEFLKHKEEYVALSGDVREEQAIERKQRKAEREAQMEEKRKKEAEDQKTLKERAKEAEEKMMKGEKLTTEDLLALQSVKD